MYQEEFDRQVGNLLQKGYPGAADTSPEEFIKCLEPLKDSVDKLAALEMEEREGYLPFVVVIKSEMVAGSRAMPLVEREGKKGIVSLQPVAPEKFTPIESVSIPSGLAYLLVDIDRGKETLNIAPNEAIQKITEKNRSPLTIEEGIAVLTQHPAFLQKNNCFSLLASRCGDKRVPALWISEGRPKLGWCWAGNPHTWLGSASCGNRLAAGG